MLVPSAAMLRFSTADFPERDSVEAWRSLFGHTICGLEIEPRGERPFVSEASLRVLPGLGVATGQSSGAHYWRPNHRINSDDLVFVINHAGCDLARMSGREQELLPGHAVLFATDRVGGTTNAGLSRFTTLRLPRSAVPAADDAVLRTVGPDNEALRLLGSYLGILRDTKALATPEQQERVVIHIHHLIAMAVEAPGAVRSSATRTGLAAARLHAIKRDIALNALEPDLQIAWIAARHQVTPRYVQMLFAQAGTHFSEYLRTARLAAAYAMLLAPTDRQKSIGEIALDAGFGNISHFNRAFRREFNATPSEVRACRLEDC
ncbi:helix-turn-helix domain-containing protein [Phreatobacter aquaticus]|nr:helix-turn-helix domain-containing protein [Phreatobacter aquaticus]